MASAKVKVTVPTRPYKLPLLTFSTISTLECQMDQKRSSMNPNSSLILESYYLMLLRVGLTRCVPQDRLATSTVKVTALFGGSSKEPTSQDCGLQERTLHLDRRLLSAGFSSGTLMKDSPTGAMDIAPSEDIGTTLSLVLLNPT